MLTHDDVKRRAKEDGIEFFFAQFVDMHGKPSAKLVPMSNFDGMFDEGAGFAGFAAGPMGQTPASPDMLAIPDVSSYTKVPWQDGPRAVRVRRHGRGQAVALLPAHDPPQRDRARGQARLSHEDRARGRVLPRAQGRRRPARRRRPSTRSTSPVTTSRR